MKLSISYGCNYLQMGNQMRAIMLAVVTELKDC